MYSRVDAVPPNLSRRVTEKKRKHKTKNAFRNPSRRVARAPRNVQPRALSRRQKASRVPTSTAARVSRVAKKVVVVVVVVRVSSFLSSKSVSSFLMTQQTKRPPFSKCEKVSAFFFVFLFFFWTKKSAFFSLFFLSFFLSFFLLLFWMFWTRVEDVFTELHFCDTREFCIAPRSNNPLFCFPTQHLQAHLQEHQRGASLFWGRKRVVGARGELCALTSPVEGGDRDRRRERLVFFFSSFFFLGICTEFNTCSLLPLGVFSQKHVVEEEAKKPPQEEKNANANNANANNNNNIHAGKQ